MLLEHLGRRPRVHETSYVAPNAVACGDVEIGPNASILFGAVVTAESGPVEVGAHSIVMEQAVLRGVSRHPLRIGDHVLVGPHAHLTGCTIEDCVFVATGASVFNGARIATRSEVRINAVVHTASVVEPDTTVPIGWIAVGDPARLFPPDAHDDIWAVQQGLDFPGRVFGVVRSSAGQTRMPEITDRYSQALSRYADAVNVEE